MENNGIQITWLGTAAFRIKTRKTDFLTDPFISRNSMASPVQALGPEHFGQFPLVFLSHGHFDHAKDLPKIQPERLCCAQSLSPGLIKKGIPEKRLIPIRHDGQGCEINSCQATAFFSRHIRFDLPLVKDRARAGLFDLLPCIRLLWDWPCGQVLSWQFFLNKKVIHFFGSAGSTKEELQKIAAKGPVHILMLPLQGRSTICDTALDYVRILKPQTVIAHHHDDFYPPVSRSEDITPFTRGMARKFPQIRLIIPRINRPVRV